MWLRGGEQRSVGIEGYWTETWGKEGMISLMLVDDPKFCRNDKWRKYHPC